MVSGRPSSHPAARLAVILAASAAWSVHIGAIPIPAAATLPAAESIARADSLWSAGSTDMAFTVLDSLEPRVRALGDTVSLTGVLFRRGSWGGAYGHAVESEAPLREALALAGAAGDTSLTCPIVRWLAVAVGSQGRMAEADSLWHNLLFRARRVGDRAHEAWAYTGIAWCAWRAGRNAPAREDYERAVVIFREIGHRRGELFALDWLGNTLQDLGYYEEARETYLQSLALADSSRSAIGRAEALNNLATVEYKMGDPGEAARHFRQAYETHESIGQIRFTIIPGINTALCLRQLGRTHAADRLLQTLLDRCRREGYADLEASVLGDIGDLRAAEGLPTEAAACYRAVLVPRFADLIENQAEATLGLSRALARVDSVDAALRLLTESLGRYRDRVEPALTMELEQAAGELLLRSGRPDQALARLAALAPRARAHGLTAIGMQSLEAAARSAEALDLPDSAMALLLQASHLWESARTVPADPEWREERGTWAREVYGELARLTLEHPRGVPAPERIRRTFDLLQRFKARTLHERMTGPSSLSPPVEPPGTGPDVADLRRLQGEVLRPGELFLDAFIGPSQSLLFAVTRDSVRVARLPGDVELTRTLRLFRDMVAAPPGPSPPPELQEAVEGAQLALGRLLFGGLEDLLETGARVLVAPDGLLNLIPVAALRLPTGEPLVAGHEVVTVPSATILTDLRLRTRNPRPPTKTPRILAVAGNSAPGTPPLEGARREVAALAHRYRSVDLRWGSGRISPALSATDLEGYDIVHLAAHVVLDDQSPWRSGIRLEEAGGEDRTVRASGISTLRLSARLTVLSGCESAGGRVLSGEGVLGLSSAFLSAGVPAVLATLWPVDDARTADCIADFYRGLEQGESPARALRRAQAAIRADPATQHPFYWAGFVLIGDGDASVVPARKGVSRITIGAGIVLFLFGVGWFRRRQLRRGRL